MLDIKRQKCAGSVLDWSGGGKKRMRKGRRRKSKLKHSLAKIRPSNEYRTWLIKRVRDVGTTLKRGGL